MKIEKQGETILLRPMRPDWRSFADEPRADDNFLIHRPEVVEEGRVALDKDEESE